MKRPTLLSEIVSVDPMFALLAAAVPVLILPFVWLMLHGHPVAAMIALYTCVLAALTGYTAWSSYKSKLNDFRRQEELKNLRSSSDTPEQVLAIAQRFREGSVAERMVIEWPERRDRARRRKR